MGRHGNTSFLEIPGTTPMKRTSQDSNGRDVIDHLDYMEDVQGKKTTGSSHLIPMGLRSRSASPFPRHGMTSPARVTGLGPTSSTSWTPTPKRSWGRFWSRHRGVILVGCAQVFGALMNLSARLLELDGEGMHPFQILFFRMSITTVCSILYMWYTKVPHFPLGAKEVRGLLVARGLSGFVSRQTTEPFAEVMSQTLTLTFLSVWHLRNVVRLILVLCSYCLILHPR
jgi:hypothetical protein